MGPDNQQPASDNQSSPYRRPEGVSLVAKTHWLVSGIIFGSVVFVQVVVQKFPVEASARTYVITLSLGFLYLLAGTLVWIGAPFGRTLSQICSLIYLARPQLGPRLWRIMDSPEFRAHFARRPRARG
jgi:hypothetical protein